MLKRWLRTRSGCMGKSVLDFHAAEQGNAPKDQGFARVSGDCSGQSLGLKVARLGAVDIAAENSLAIADDLPRFGNADFTPAKNSVNGEFDGVFDHAGLAKINFDAAEDRGDRAALEVQCGDAAFDAAEEREFVEGGASIGVWRNPAGFQGGPHNRESGADQGQGPE